MSYNPEYGGRRAQVPTDPIIVVELEGLPLDSRIILEDEGSSTGAWVFKRTHTGNTITVSGHPDDVSKTLQSLHPPRDPSIPDTATTGLRGPTSRRALP